MTSFPQILFIFAVLFTSLVSAQVFSYRTHPTATTTSSITPYPTSVWATRMVGNSPVVALSPYTQTFKPMFSTVETPKSGSIGLGSISGTIGTVKTPIYETISAYTTRIQNH